MYYDSRNGRILLRDGKSLLSSFEVARRIIQDEDIDNFHVAVDFSSKAYDKLNKKSVSIEFEEVFPTPDSHTHTKKDFDELLVKIENSNRFGQTEEEIKRVLQELEYFSRTKNITFILDCCKLIERFKEDGIVWGVGRGSSCASYIAYVLGINDINPLKYDIPFKELTKEDDYER